MRKPTEINLPTLQAAFEAVWRSLNPLLTQNIDLNGRRVIGAGSAKGAQDYVTLAQADERYAVIERLETLVRQKTEVFKAIRFGVFADRGLAAANKNTLFAATDRGYSVTASDGTDWQRLPTDDVEDAVTAAVTTLRTLTHRSSGTVAANFGGRLLYQLEDASGNAPEDAGALDILWSDPTEASEDSTFSLKLRAAGAALAEVVSITPSATTFAGAHTIYGGAAANDDLTINGTSHATKASSYVVIQSGGGLVGIGATTPTSILHVFGSAPILQIQSSGASDTPYLRFVSSAGGAQAALAYVVATSTLYFQNPGGSNRMTLDSSGNLAVASGTITTSTSFIDSKTGFKINGAAASGNVLQGNGTLFVSATPTGTGAPVLATSPTITTPTIASFANATHNHQSAAGGGTLDLAAIASGTVNVVAPTSPDRTITITLGGTPYYIHAKTTND